MVVPQVIRLALTVAAAYAVIAIGVPALGALSQPGTWPVVPRHLLNIYLFFIVTVVLLYGSSDEARWRRVREELCLFFGSRRARVVRLAAFGVLCLVGAYVAHDAVRSRFDTPAELRAIHPAPPMAFTIDGKRYDLLTLTNPLRSDGAAFADNVRAGGEIFFRNCFFCHGDKLDGKGPFHDAFLPLPANFRDVGTIAQLQESYLFWRIATGGPGLPNEGAPWASAMPVWHRFLSEREIWQVILFLYAFTGHEPRAVER
jgi:mono/diheme cytochrome c family protein